MKELKIKFDFSHGPIWKERYNAETGEWMTGIESIDHDKALEILNDAAEREYSSLYSFKDGSFVFDAIGFQEKKGELLSLLQTILLRINSLNDGSFIVIDEESGRLA